MCNLLITDQDIAEATKAVLGEGMSLNDEQLRFIRCLDSVDLDACPGSGKSTALVAKLFILAKHRVWEKGHAICVLSHTNVAVDEIKEKVASYYPDVLQYPNFVGTLQTFIDRYMALPYYRSLNLADKAVVDDELFRSQWRQAFDVHARIGTSQFVKRQFCETIGKGKLKKPDWSKFNFERYDEFIDSINYAHKEGQMFVDLSYIRLNGRTSDSYKALSKVKQKIFIKGYLKYGDTLSLASRYLLKNKKAASMISSRFRYIFLDEAQDTSKDQFEILNRLFDNSSNCYQRLGDPRQAIYNVSSSDVCAWELKVHPFLLNLSYSNRFGTEIAAVVNDVIQRIDVRSENIDSLHRNIQRCFLIPFESGSEEQAVGTFAKKLVEVFGINATTLNVHAIGAVGKKSEDQAKLTVGSYFNDYEKKKTSNRKDYFNNYYDYIATITSTMIIELGSSVISTRLINCLAQYYRNNSSLELTGADLNVPETKFILGVLAIEIARAIISRNEIDYDSIARGMNKILSSHLKSIDPLVFSPSNSTMTRSKKHTSNIKNYYDIPIQFSTIHAVKGQTHDATLLLTTQHDKLNVTLRDDLKGTDVDYYMKQSKMLNRRKLTYVAASRPRYVFAWAIPESKLNALSVNTISHFEIVRPGLLEDNEGVSATRSKR